jgi:hypothetical protein
MSSKIKFGCSSWTFERLPTHFPLLRRHVIPAVFQEWSRPAVATAENHLLPEPGMTFSVVANAKDGSHRAAPSLSACSAIYRKLVVKSQVVNDA